MKVDFPLQTEYLAGNNEASYNDCRLLLLSLRFRGKETGYVEEAS